MNARIVVMEYFWRKRSFVYLLCALLVVFIHDTAITQYQELQLEHFAGADFLRNLTAYGLGQVAVPMFFLLSSFCFFRNYRNSKYVSKLSSRVKTLLIPFLIWNTFALLLNALVAQIPALAELSHREPFEFTLRNLFEGIFLFKYNYHFWFLFNLIIYVIASPLVNCMIKRKRLGLAVVIGALLLPAFLPESLAFAKFDLHFVVFYLLGGWLSLHYRSEFVAKFKRKYVWIALAISAFCIAFKTYSFYVPFTIAPVLLQLNLVIFCLAAWVALVPSIRNDKIGEYAQYAFPLYIVHPFIIPVVAKILFKLLPKSSFFAVANYLLSFLITVVISFVIIKMLHIMLPRFAGIIFGNREPQRARIDKE